MTQTEPRRAIPALVGDEGFDQTTGAVAPRGQRFREGGRVEHLPQIVGKDYGRLTPTGEAIVEVADMWQPGDGDMGITARLSDGAIVPRIDHVRFPVTLSDVTGDSLEISGADIELMRRDWYAKQMRQRPRLTPVHHIIGKSEREWWGFWGPPMPSALENRDAWLTLLWEPTSMLKLAQTHRHIYTLDWSRLPERAILAGLAIKIRKAGVARDEQELRRLNLKRDRARADLKQISIIGRAVNDALDAGPGPKFDEAMARASEAHSLLLANAKQYNTKAATLTQIGDW